MSYDDNDYSPSIPAGTYAARATEAALGESGDGNPQVAVYLQLISEGYEGKGITWFGSFSKNLGKGTKTPLQRTVESLRTCGWLGDDLSDLSSINGAEVSIVIEHDEYKGKVSAKVKWINRAGGIALKAPMSADKVAAFAAKMKGDVIAASRGIAPAAKPVPRPSNGGTKSSHPNAPGNDVGREPGDDDLTY